MGPSKKAEKYEVPSWDYIHELCIELADRIKRSGYEPDLLVAISRGGLIPGRILSDLLGNQNIATVKVEYYTDIYETRPRPEMTQPPSAEVKGRKILLVDDVADSGESLKLVKEHLLERGAAEVKICTLYYKPWSAVRPDFSARETDAWICFPHEVYETMRKISSKLKAEGKSPGEIEAELLRIGIKPSIVRRFAPELI